MAAWVGEVAAVRQKKSEEEVGVEEGHRPQAAEELASMRLEVREAVQVGQNRRLMPVHEAEEVVASQLLQRSILDMMCPWEAAAVGLQLVREEEAVLKECACLRRAAEH